MSRRCLQVRLDNARAIRGGGTRRRDLIWHPHSPRAISIRRSGIRWWRKSTLVRTGHLSQRNLAGTCGSMPMPSWIHRRTGGTAWGTNHRGRSSMMAWKNLADPGLPDHRVAEPAASAPWTGSFSGWNLWRRRGRQVRPGVTLDHGDFYGSVSDCGCHDNRMDKIWRNEQWLGFGRGREPPKKLHLWRIPPDGGHLLLIVGNWTQCGWPRRCSCRRR